MAQTSRPSELILAGTAYCIISALCYAVTNICLRQLAGLETPAIWVICVKESVTVAVIGPWLLFCGWRGMRLVPPPRALVVLVLTALAVQWVGNLGVQWAFGIIGLATTIPLVFGTMLTTGALMGLAFLGERVPGRSIAAIGLLVLSIAMLSLGTSQTSEVLADAEPSVTISWRLLAVGAACLAGCMYATLSTVIRRAVTTDVPVTTVVFIVTATGALSLGVLSYWQLGPRTLFSTNQEQLSWMLAAGVLNLIAFLTITKGLQLTTIVRANLLNASQVAMAALAGWLWFGEAMDVWLSVGIVLTVAGILLIGTSSPAKPAPEAVVPSELTAPR